MNKLFLIKNQELFQGEKYLSKGKNYKENNNIIFSDTSTNCGLEIV